MDVDGKIIRIKRCNGVYFPAEDSILLYRSIKPQRKCLEIGCGSGFISILLAMDGLDVTSADINCRAVKCTEENAALNNVVLKTICCDLFHGVEGKFDTIIFNPPYLPGEPGEEKASESEQWHGGEDGLSIVRSFLRGLIHHLQGNGKCYLILSSLTNINGLIHDFREYEFTRIAEDQFFMEKIFVYMVSLI